MFEAQRQGRISFYMVAPLTIAQLPLYAQPLTLGRYQQEKKESASGRRPLSPPTMWYLRSTEKQEFISNGDSP
jgi:hypothetical protein